MKQERGLLIVLEGLDRCGKSTQVKLLVDHLRSLNKEVKLLTFPDRTTMLGGIISNYLKGTTELKDEVIHLLFAANRWEKNNEMKELLNKGVNIICDRYAYSGIAFSAAKGLPLNWCKSADSKQVRPDILFYLNAQLNILLERGDFGLERYENKDFQTKVKTYFDDMIDQEHFTVISAEQTAENVHKEIVEKLNEKLKQEVGPISYLWDDIFIDKEDRVVQH